MNNVNEKNGENILMIASRHGYDRGIKVLIRKGADVNSVDKEGGINHFRCVKLLLLAGAHINKYNKCNCNALCENLYWFDGGTHHRAPHKPETEAYTLLYAAGELLPGVATSQGKMLINTMERVKRLYHVLFEDLRFDLKHTNTPTASESSRTSVRQNTTARSTTKRIFIVQDVFIRRRSPQLIP